MLDRLKYLHPNNLVACIAIIDIDLILLFILNRTPTQWHMSAASKSYFRDIGAIMLPQAANIVIQSAAERTSWDYFLCFHTPKILNTAFGPAFFLDAEWSHEAHFIHRIHDSDGFFSISCKYASRFFIGIF